MVFLSTPYHGILATLYLIAFASSLVTEVLQPRAPKLGYIHPGCTWLIDIDLKKCKIRFGTSIHLVAILALLLHPDELQATSMVRSIVETTSF